VLPVMDLRKRFGLATQPGSPSNRIIVARLGGVDLGMLVDGVSEVLTIPDEWIEPPRPAGLAGANGLIGMAKISERTVTLLDLGKFLTAKERSGLLNLQKVIEA
ncbi:MAG: chemotaxis protein CheW, partial [Chloroflexi bacterium]|nr:chemotaxis protein CheW [Chloroflexota bacterium]